MKKLKLLFLKPSFAILIVIVLFSNTLQGQNCTPGTAYRNIDINNIRARINNGGDLFDDYTKIEAKFEAPKTSSAGQTKKYSIFASTLWIGGYSKGVLKAAAMTYRQTGVDFWPGPLDTVNASISLNECGKWDKIWKIDRTTIDSFKAGLLSNIPNDIATWPAHGDISKGQAKYLAPFVDVNKDGEYNPAQGDYPAIKGDQMLWWIFNDKGNIHTESNAYSIGAEIHASAYAFRSSVNNTINNTIFIDYQIINRSKERLDSAYIGNWTDLDLGYSFDDYIGSDSALGAYFAYNGDNDDEGISGYGINPPAQSVVFLNKPMSKFLYYNNNYSLVGHPVKPKHYYFYLDGRWQDGRRMTYGGDGRTSSTIPVNYMFSGDPEKNDSSTWNERTAGLPPMDIRGVGSTGPITFEPGQKENITFAYIFSGGLSQMKKDIASVHNFYDQMTTTSVANLSQQNEINVNIYPNPANEEIFISSGNLSTTSIRLINTVGQEVLYIRNLKTGLNSFSIKELPIGFYTVLVETKEGITAKKLLISR